MPEKQRLKPPPVNGFKKGQSGNPTGRPKNNKTFTDLIRRVNATLPITADLKEEFESKYGISLPEDATMQYLSVVRVHEMAVSGDMKAIDFLADRLDGKPIPITPGDEEQKPDVTKENLAKYLQEISGAKPSGK